MPNQVDITVKCIEEIDFLYSRKLSELKAMKHNSDFWESF